MLQPGRGHTCDKLAQPQSSLSMSSIRHAETISIEGADAIAFAHAQFSSHVASLQDGQWHFSAWLDPQGRVRVLFHLARLSEQHLLMLLRGGDAATIADALRRFVFRSKVVLTARSSRALNCSDALPLHVLQASDEDVLLGCGDHSLRIGNESESEKDDRWQLAQLRMGWPWLSHASLNEFLPAALSLQRLGAVAVDKGCYPGQEIVARLHFRGGHKRHLHSVELSQPMNCDESLYVEQRSVGRLLDVVRSDASVDALAVLSDDFIAQHADKQLTSLDNNIAIRVLASWPA
jgi:tRNA-modifying protein YgfZ